MLYFFYSLHLGLDCCKIFWRWCLGLSLKYSLIFLGTRNFSIIWEMLKLLFKSSFLFMARLFRFGWLISFVYLFVVDQLYILVCLQGLKDLQLVQKLCLRLGCKLLRDVPLSLGETWSSVDPVLCMLAICTSITANNLLGYYLLN